MKSYCCLCQIMHTATNNCNVNVIRSKNVTVQRVTASCSAEARMSGFSCHRFQQTQFVNWSDQSRCLGYHLYRTNESVIWRVGFCYATKLPRISRWVVVYQNHNVTSFQASGGTPPLLSWLECREILPSPSPPKYISKILNLPPATTTEIVLFDKFAWRWDWVLSQQQQVIWC